MPITLLDIILMAVMLISGLLAMIRGFMREILSIGARGVAELPLVPFLPAVAAAIHDATGVWLTEQPFTPERVLAALEQQAAPEGAASSLAG